MILTLQSIVSHNCQDLVRTVPFFQNASPQFVTAIITKLKFEVFLKGEYIIREGSIGNKMYFVQNGVVAVLSKEKQVETRLSDGSHFGEIGLLTHDRRVASIRAETICDLFSLSKKHFQSILKEYPSMKCALETIAMRRLSKLGMKPKARGTLSTLIPPPHIAKQPDSPPSEIDEEEPEKKTIGWSSIKRHLLRLKRDSSKKNTADEQNDTQTAQSSAHNGTVLASDADAAQAASGSTSNSITEHLEDLFIPCDPSLGYGDVPLTISHLTENDSSSDESN